MQIELKKLRISDIKNNLSKDIYFKSGFNLITSAHNSVGKSVLMKSIYHTFGADSEFDSIFAEQNTLFEIEFTYNKMLYKISRYKNQFNIFKNNELIKYVKSGGRNSLSMFYKDEFKMATYLKNREFKTELAPPAYLFIPYYLDQDRSWKIEQFPFSSQTMNQYTPISKNDLYLYHLGSYDLNYGNIKSELDNLNKGITELNDKRNELDDAYNTIKTKLSSMKIVQKTEELESLQRSVSKKIGILLNKQDEIQSKIYDLDKEKLSNSIRVKEDEKIIAKLNENIENNSLLVVCPNCNEQFDLELKSELLNIYNSNVLKAEIESLRQKNKAIEFELDQNKKSLLFLSNEIKETDELIKQTKVNYKNYVYYSALSDLLDSKLVEIGNISKKIGDIEKERDAKNAMIKKIREKTDNVKTDFCSYYVDYLIELGNDMFDPTKIKAFKKVSLSGSQYIRSTLAMYFSFLKTKDKYNQDNFNWPLVIDSPREGEQDNFNSEKILNFILKQPLGNKQCIVATIDGDKFLSDDLLKSINVIKFTNDKGFIMNKSDYSKNASEIAMSLAYFS